MEYTDKEIKKCPISWWKRIWIMGFWFFFFKGIAWIIGILIIYIWGENVFKNAKSYILEIL